MSLGCVLCRRLLLLNSTKCNSRVLTSRNNFYMATKHKCQQTFQLSFSLIPSEKAKCNRDNSSWIFKNGKSMFLTQRFENDTRAIFPLYSTFCFQNSLYDAYLKSLESELNDLESSEVIGSNSHEHKRRLHFLQLSCHMIQKLNDKQKEIQELKQVMETETDEDMKLLLQKEMEHFNNDLVENQEELVKVLVGNDIADRNGVILEVSAGVGGQEAMLFCAEIFNMYYNYSIIKGWNIADVFQDEVGLGGFRKASMEISGIDVYRYLKHEAGVHRVQRVPKTEKSGRIHTSTISVSVLPQPDEIDIQLDKKDLKIETFRGSGPGGQSVNTTDSAVRITHLPSGVVAECRQERSQIKNKDIAMARLKLRIAQIQLDKAEAERRATRKLQMGSRGRSEKIRTYNFQQDRVTDHRVKENYSNLPVFMSGGDDLEELILKVEQADRYQILNSMIDEFERSSIIK